jgi:drug/metabolite transporter (DMT)-like permease
MTTIVIRTTAMAKASAEKMLFYQIGVSAFALLLISYFSNEVWQWNFSAFALTSILIQTSAGAFASYLAWMWLLARYPATKIGTFVFLTPVFALIFGALWLNEAVTLSLIGALAMVGVGIALVNKRKSA